MATLSERFLNALSSNAQEELVALGFFRVASTCFTLHHFPKNPLEPTRIHKTPSFMDVYGILWVFLDPFAF